MDSGETVQPIPYCLNQTAANNLVNERIIPANSLFINSSNKNNLGVARLLPIPSKIQLT